MEHAKHILRAVLLVTLTGLVFVFVRHFAQPASFGEHGHYRYDSVGEHRSAEIVHGPGGSCDGCHEDQAVMQAAAGHASVSCQVCHDTPASHVGDDGKTGVMPVDRSDRLCRLCHEQLVARPSDFPQVPLVIGGEDHVTENGGEWNEATCLECHDAHDPSE